MPSPAALGNVGILIGLLSPVIAWLVPNFRWWFAALLVEVSFVAGAIWIIGEAVDTEAAKPRENLDILLGYAINFWMVVIGGFLFAGSFVVRAAILRRKRKALRAGVVS
jgi:hypothetical protein